MELLKFENGRPAAVLADTGALPAAGYAWLDLAYEETDALAERVMKLTGVHIYEDHLSDVRNLGHPSSFDSTEHYELVIFRGLAPTLAPAGEVERIRSQPMFLFNFDRLLVTVRAADSRAIAEVRGRFVGVSAKCPGTVDELMHRLLSAMVDQYLALRQPMTQRLERWQHALLDPKRPFRDWNRLLEGRSDLRRLQELCEEQHDAVQEWRDYRLGDISERLQVRFADLIEHIQRVQRHAYQTERQAESAVQLYFAATANRTSEIMRLLTLITAVFMPLNLITGVYGMNFEFLPGLHSPVGFWVSLGSMAAVVLAMVMYFRSRHWL